MPHFLDQAEKFDLSFRLTNEEMENPLQILKEFFCDYNLNELRHTLWEIVEACLTTDNDQFSEAEQRGDLLTFYEKAETLLEAVYILVKQNTPEKH